MDTAPELRFYVLYSPDNEPLAIYLAPVDVQDIMQRFEACEVSGDAAIDIWHSLPPQCRFYVDEDETEQDNE